MVALACDHLGLALKEEIVGVLNELGMEYRDFGTCSAESCDYPIYALRAASAVASGECECGVLLCGTGAGIGMAAGKVRGIRCVICSEPYTARYARLHNDANMLAMGSRVVGGKLAAMIAREFLTAAFEGGRHARRVGMISRIENGEALE